MKEMDIEQQTEAFTLLKAALDILNQCNDSTIVLEPLHCITVWDSVAADGYCLMNEIEQLLDNVGNPDLSTKSIDELSGLQENIQSTADKHKELIQDQIRLHIFKAILTDENRNKLLIRIKDREILEVKGDINDGIIECYIVSAISGKRLKIGVRNSMKVASVFVPIDQLLPFNIEDLNSYSKSFFK